MSEKPTFKNIDEDADHMSLEEWLDCASTGCFIDYDGLGHLATGDQESDIRIWPSQAEGYQFPSWATHIVWYNR